MITSLTHDCMKLNLVHQTWCFQFDSFSLTVMMFHHVFLSWYLHGLKVCLSSPADHLNITCWSPDHLLISCAVLENNLRCSHWSEHLIRCSMRSWRACLAVERRLSVWIFISTTCPPHTVQLQSLCFGSLFRGFYFPIGPCSDPGSPDRFEAASRRPSLWSPSFPSPAAFHHHLQLFLNEVLFHPESHLSGWNKWVITAAYSASRQG